MNQIHPTAIIGPHVEIGEGNFVGPYAVVLGNVQIGNDNWIGPNSVIGTPAQMRGGPHSHNWTDRSLGGLIEIGNQNIIREFTTIHEGTIQKTRIGNNCYFMTQAHVPHDAVIEDDVTLSNSAQLGGHTIVQTGANIGLGAVVHQRSLIGARAMVGMGSVVTKAIPPFGMAFGSPAKIRGGNIVGMQRAGLTEDLISKIVAALNAADFDHLRKLIPLEMEKFDSATAIQSH